MHAPAMSRLRHASLARQLMAACGNATAIVADKACRLTSTSRLYEFGDANTDAYMPADVIADLEAHCGEPIYSRALVENRPAAVNAAELLTEAMETTELSASLMSVVRKAAADGRIDAAEKRSIDRLLEQLEQQLRETREANERRAS